MNRIIKAVVIMSVLVVPAYCQKVWEKEPYNEWTLAEVGQILYDSPWAQEGHETTRLGHNLPGASYSATIRLRSALPIRQALVRRRQLAVNYDVLSSIVRTRFDAETKEFLACTDCPKYYIVTLVSHIPAGFPNMSLPGNWTVPSSYGVDISVPLKSLSLNDLKPYVHLTNDKGERRELVGFIPPAGAGEGKESMFIFPRFDDQGKLLITASNKQFSFEIDKPVFKKMPGPLKKFTFEVSRLVQNGEIIF